MLATNRDRLRSRPRSRSGTRRPKLNIMPVDRLVVADDDTTDRHELDAPGYGELQGLSRRLCAAVN